MLENTQQIMQYMWTGEHLTFQIHDPSSELLKGHRSESLTLCIDTAWRWVLPVFSILISHIHHLQFYCNSELLLPRCAEWLGKNYPNKSLSHQCKLIWIFNFPLKVLLVQQTNDFIWVPFLKIVWLQHQIRHWYPWIRYWWEGGCFSLS